MAGLVRCDNYTYGCLMPLTTLEAPTLDSITTIQGIAPMVIDRMGSNYLKSLRRARSYLLGGTIGSSPTPLFNAHSQFLYKPIRHSPSC